ncbi:MAG: hypothetical protein H7Z41_12995 [Cytophagales bacterium]|nr:hypothetical protein [Armatimonadota bacterium]
MTYDEIILPRTFPLADAARAVEVACEAEGLRVATRGTLADQAGSIHWHYKRGKETGMLEVTLLNRERRILLSVQKNREAPWTEAALEAISAALTARTVNYSAPGTAGSALPQTEITQMDPSDPGQDV